MGEPVTAFWNGEPCEARRVSVVVGDAPEFPAYWAREFVGQRRDAVEVTYNSETFYLDDAGGRGWLKVTDGRGSPRWGHQSLAVKVGSVRERAKDWAAEGAVQLYTDRECSFCDVRMERWEWPDHTHEWFYCPCCRCRVRTPEQIRATMEAHAASVGLTLEEWEAQAAEAEALLERGLMRGPTSYDLERALALAVRMEEEWVPPCEHVTENPWTG